METWRRFSFFNRHRAGNLFSVGISLRQFEQMKDRVAGKPARDTFPPALSVARPVARVRHHAPAGTAPSDLRGEIALIDAARNAVTHASCARALALLDRYEASYPTGTFRPEATVLRVEALSGLGRAAEARVLARRFMAVHPDSPLAARVSRQAGAQLR